MLKILLTPAINLESAKVSAASGETSTEAVMGRAFA